MCLLFIVASLFLIPPTYKVLVIVIYVLCFQFVLLFLTISKSPPRLPTSSLLSIFLSDTLWYSSSLTSLTTESSVLGLVSRSLLCS